MRRFARRTVRKIAARPSRRGQSGDRGRIRGTVRKGSRSDHSPRVAIEARGLKDPTMCEICGAVYTRKTWRAGPRTSSTSLIGVGWTVCPACRQGREGEYYGRVLIPGPMSAATAELVTRRIRNVAARARFTQPERRVVSMATWDGGLEILTTSQKLAHRIARELAKAFGGRTRYRWASRDGELMATWISTEAAEGAANGSTRRAAR
jgi:hypothetical protein